MWSITLVGLDIIDFINVINRHILRYEPALIFCVCNHALSLPDELRTCPVTCLLVKHFAFRLYQCNP